LRGRGRKVEMKWEEDHVTEMKKKNNDKQSEEANEK